MSDIGYQNQKEESVGIKANYDSLQTPSVCKEDGLAALGVAATSLQNAGVRFLKKADRNQRRYALRRICQR